MDLSAFTLFGLQTTCTYVTLGLLAWIYLWPWSKRQPLRNALMALMFVHGFRHLGMTALAPGMSNAELPRELAISIAWGDFGAMVLAILSILALYNRWSVAIPLVWVANILGCADLAYHTVQAILTHSTPGVEASLWVILNFYVPMAWVASILMLLLLINRRNEGIHAET